MHGFVEDVTGKRVATLFGKWDDNMYYMSGNINVKPKDFTSANASLLWKRTMPSPNLTRYNLTPFAITLNELTPGLKVYNDVLDHYLIVRIPLLIYASLIVVYSFF